jgi:hypothetical protein
MTGNIMFCGIWNATFWCTVKLHKEYNHQTCKKMTQYSRCVLDWADAKGIAHSDIEKTIQRRINEILDDLQTKVKNGELDEPFPNFQEIVNETACVPKPLHTTQEQP